MTHTWLTISAVQGVQGTTFYISGVSGFSSLTQGKMSESLGKGVVISFFIDQLPQRSNPLVSRESAPAPTETAVRV